MPKGSSQVALGAIGLQESSYTSSRILKAEFAHAIGVTKVFEGFPALGVANAIDSAYAADGNKQLLRIPIFAGPPAGFGRLVGDIERLVDFPSQFEEACCAAEATVLENRVSIGIVDGLKRPLK